MAFLRWSRDTGWSRDTANTTDHTTVRVGYGQPSTHASGLSSDPVVIKTIEALAAQVKQLQEENERLKERLRDERSLRLSETHWKRDAVKSASAVVCVWCKERGSCWQIRATWAETGSKRLQWFCSEDCFFEFTGDQEDYAIMLKEAKEALGMETKK